MKKFRILSAWAFILSFPAVNAAVTLNTDFGNAYNSSGVAVGTGTLWALVVDHDTNNTFAGFGLDGSLYSANVSSPGIANNFFTANQTISLGGVVGGGTVFAMGGFSGNDGSTVNQVITDLGINGLVAGRNFAFYWFAGAAFTGVQSNPQTISNQVGGIQNNTSNVGGGGFTTGMVIPADGNTVTVGANNIARGGSIANNEFLSVTLIPEPSTLLLSALGVLALLRRRR